MQEETNSASRPLNRRQIAKIRTHRVALDRAKELFASRPYEAVTTRDIATAMGMSTGAIFANFGSKDDLFFQIVLEDMESQYKRMCDVANEGGELRQLLLDVLSVTLEANMEQVELVRARFGILWIRAGVNDEKVRELRNKVRALDYDMRVLVERIITEAAGTRPVELLRARGRASMLWNLHQSNYRYLSAGCTLKELQKELLRQIDFVIQPR